MAEPAAGARPPASAPVPLQTHLPTPAEDTATGALATVYRNYLHSHDRPTMPPILRCFAARPDVLEHVIALSDTLHFSDGHLDRRTKEAIATYVSALNHCPY